MAASRPARPRSHQSEAGVVRSVRSQLCDAAPKGAVARERRQLAGEGAEQAALQGGGQEQLTLCEGARPLANAVLVVPHVALQPRHRVAWLRQPVDHCFHHWRMRRAAARVEALAQPKVDAVRCRCRRPRRLVSGVAQVQRRRQLRRGRRRGAPQHGVRAALALPAAAALPPEDGGKAHRDAAVALAADVLHVAAVAATAVALVEDGGAADEVAAAC